MADYIDGSILSASFHVPASMMVSVATKFYETYMGDPIPNPFLFAAAYTVFVDYTRYRKEFPFKIEDNPAIFLSAAFAYTLIERCWF